MTTPSSSIESLLIENRIFPPAPATVKAARISGMPAYNALCAEAEADFEGFWARLARENLSWEKPFTQVLDESNVPFYQWFADGELNASYNCLDRHLGTPVENKKAIIFESDDGQVTNVTYKELHAKVSQFASALKAMGIKKGDRVVIYMPMTVEGVVAMQACARIGATHSVVFGGFSAKALQERIIDAGAVAVITANFQMRGGKELPLKAIVDEGLAMGGCESIRTVFVYQRTKSPPGRRRNARLNSSVPSTRCSFSTPRARPASPRACSTARAATCCGPSSRWTGRLICSHPTCSGAPPILAGLLATPTSRTDRWRQAQPRSCLKACRLTRTPGAFGT